MPIAMPQHIATLHRVGDTSVTKVVEQCGPGFAPDFLFPDWDAAVLQEHRGLMVPDCFSEAEGKFIASIHSWLVRTRHHTILIDTCAGNGKHRPATPRFHMLDTPYLARLAAAGVAPEQVDFVLCTHLHADHSGWNTRLLDGRWVPTFPNARYVFSKAEQDHWSGPAGKEGFNAGVYEDSVLPVVESGQALVIDGAGGVGDGLLFEPTPGHSPGHVAVRLQDGGREALFSSDVMHQPLQIFRPDWNSRFCIDAGQARASRRWLLDTAVERQATVFTAHFGSSSAGHVCRHGDGFGWTFA